MLKLFWFFGLQMQHFNHFSGKAPFASFSTVYSIQFCIVFPLPECGVGVSVHCTVYTVQCTMYSVQYTVFIVQSSVYSVQFCGILPVPGGGGDDSVHPATVQGHAEGPGLLQVSHIV